MTVVTISREFGSGGDEVASRLCAELGYLAFGKEQIIQAAKETTLSKLNAIDYSEDNHEIQTFLDRLFGRGASPVQKIAWSENPAIATRPDRADVQDTAVISLIKGAVRAAVGIGNMVIIGRGGQVLLKATPGVLHVRIEAPVDMRIERVKQTLKNEPGASKFEKELYRAAAEIIATRDKASADYLQHYYYVDWNNPSLYHLVLNLGRLSIEQATAILVSAVHAM
jgi:cytidylate kinase